MKPHLLISVVITTYNRSDALLAVLRALSQQTDLEFEVIVADDGSQLQHQQSLCNSKEVKKLRVLHIWHPDEGFTAAKIRNRGVAAAQGNYIVFLDGDCVPERDFVFRHKQLAQVHMFVNGSRVMLSPDLTQKVVSGTEDITGRNGIYWIKQRLLGHASKLSQLLRLPDSERRQVPFFSWKGIRSCNMGVWRSDLEAVNGFDESFVGWGHEDADFVLRLHNHGVVRKNGYCATEVYHLWHPQSPRNMESQNARTVRERAQTQITRAELGYSQTRSNDDVVITRLG